MFCRVLLPLLFLVIGCGSEPLKITPQSGTIGPWCAPNQRVQIGQRIVSRGGWDGPIWKNFLIDDTGKELDPSTIQEQVWSAMERSGDADIIKERYSKSSIYSYMTVISLKPIVVTLESKKDKKFAETPERYYWKGCVSCVRHPIYREGMEWFSTDLKQKITPLKFSPEGVAEIPLKTGRLKITRGKERCEVTRE